MLDQIMVAMIVVGQKCSSQSAFFEKQCIPVHVGRSIVHACTHVVIESDNALKR
jgi:hypothetical protein